MFCAGFMTARPWATIIYKRHTTGSVARTAAFTALDIHLIERPGDSVEGFGRVEFVKGVDFGLRNSFGGNTPDLAA